MNDADGLTSCRGPRARLTNRSGQPPLRAARAPRPRYREAPYHAADDERDTGDAKGEPGHPGSGRKAILCHGDVVAEDMTMMMAAVSVAQGPK
jgi:hypothetical protein